jgi:hypothetical protein
MKAIAAKGREKTTLSSIESTNTFMLKSHRSECTGVIGFAMDSKEATFE